MYLFLEEIWLMKQTKNIIHLVKKGSKENKEGQKQKCWVSNYNFKIIIINLILKFLQLIMNDFEESKKMELFYHFMAEKIAVDD